MTASLPVLTLAETRVLGTLLEKQRTVPDTYPLSLNALVAGCNQKTSRQPVLDLSEADVAQALAALKEAGLTVEVSGSRVPRFEHRLEKALAVPAQAAALLAVLMLRGPQTAGELRLNSERLHRFADISSVDAFLDELAGRDLVVELPRLPGARENRWSHLLSGRPAVSEAPTAILRGCHDELSELKARVAALEAEVGELRGLLLAG
ncbi:MAG: YceH family protein [Betaproteobacteria bacterium]|nr:YceH family protein [Betaproteobacteria bacterium]